MCFSKILELYGYFLKKNIILKISIYQIDAFVYVSKYELTALLNDAKFIIYY